MLILLFDGVFSNFQDQKLQCRKDVEETDMYLTDRPMGFEPCLDGHVEVT